MSFLRILGPQSSLAIVQIVVSYRFEARERQSRRTKAEHLLTNTRDRSVSQVEKLEPSISYIQNAIGWVRKISQGDSLHDERACWWKERGTASCHPQWCRVINPNRVLVGFFGLRRLPHDKESSNGIPCVSKSDAPLLGFPARASNRVLVRAMHQSTLSVASSTVGCRTRSGCWVSAGMQ